MLRQPPFQHFSPFLKILSLIMVMIITFFFFLALGAGFSILFSGRNLLDSLAGITDYTDPRTIVALKYFQIVNQVGVFIAPAFLFVILTDNQFMQYLGLDKGSRTYSYVLGFVLLVVSLPFVNWLVEINGQIHLPAALEGLERWMRNSEEDAKKLTDAFLSSGSWGGFLVNLLMIAVLAAVGEELIFRGILVRLFREWSGNVHLAVILPALLFSALHLQFYGFFGRFLLGVLLGYLFVWSRSLWLPVFVHFMNNAMAVVVSFLVQRGMVETDLESFGASGNNMVIFASAVLMVITMVMIYLHEGGRLRGSIK